MRIGKFKVAREFIFGEKPEFLAVVFSNAVPVKIEWDYQNIATYTVLCDWFLDLEDGVDPPLYEPVVTTRLNGPPSIEFRRI